MKNMEKKDTKKMNIMIAVMRRKNLSDMPQELLFEILSWLPIRDLYSSKCVSKQWRSLIREPEFTKLHSRRNQEPSLGLLISVSENGEEKFFYSSLKNSSLKPSPFVQRFSVSHSQFQGITQIINSLACVYTENQVFLMNVCTQETIKLPDPEFYANPHSVHYFFGYDVINNVYKLLRTVNAYKKHECRNSGLCGCYNRGWHRREILTLGKGSSSSWAWRKLEVLPYFYSPLFNSQSFCVNGTLYWWRPNSPNELLYFSLEDEILGYFTIGCKFTQFARSEGRLARLCVIQDDIEGIGNEAATSLMLQTLENCNRNDWHSRHICEFPENLLPKNKASSSIYDVIPVGNLPNGNVLLANFEAHEAFTPVYALNQESEVFEEWFVAGKFQSSLSFTNQMDASLRITCIEENISPLSALFGGEND